MSSVFGKGYALHHSLAAKNIGRILSVSEATLKPGKCDGGHFLQVLVYVVNLFLLYILWLVLSVKFASNLFSQYAVDA